MYCWRSVPLPCGQYMAIFIWQLQGGLNTNASRGSSDECKLEVIFWHFSQYVLSVMMWCRQTIRFLKKWQTLPKLSGLGFIRPIGTQIETDWYLMCTAVNSHCVHKIGRRTCWWTPLAEKMYTKEEGELSSCTSTPTATNCPPLQSTQQLPWNSPHL